MYSNFFARYLSFIKFQVSRCSWHKCIHVCLTGESCRATPCPSSDIVLPKAERPKSLDLYGQPRTLRLPVPQLGSSKQQQLHLAADRLVGVEEEDNKDSDKEDPQVEASGGTVRRTGIEVGFDPLSLMATEKVKGSDEVGGSGGEAAPARRDLAEEIETYMNGGGSPLRSRAPGADPRSPSSPSASSPRSSPRPPTLLRSNTGLQLAAKSKERLRPSPSLPLGGRDRERPSSSSAASPSSPTPSASSFSMDSLFTPTLDIFKSSVISAGKGVAEKASRLYCRLSSQTSLTQVGRANSSDCWT